MRFLFRKLISQRLLPIARFSTANANEVKNVDDDKGVENSDQIRKNIVVEKYGAITTINIDRQKTRNSLNEATLREMTTAIDDFDADTEAKVLLINGEGGSFCSGFDIDELGEKGWMCLQDAGSRLCRRPLCEKPTIAAVAGYAVGEGFELALACDLRVIEDTAMLGCLGRRFGSPQSLAGSRRLTSLIGLSQALDLLITGRLISGKEAHAKGLATKLTATGTALGEAVKLAKSLIKFPQSALIMDKLAAINSQLDENSDERMRDEALWFSYETQALEDLKEGVKKFQAGIGKHGKFYKLTQVTLKDWELEDSIEETIVIEDEEDSKAKPKS
ncbi:Probable enoyl-CoA hydratase echA8 [Eumeta japonica]|uniref:Probable enoyl-CoA hydratase echA8 n=1 Tax=Eumeta variegata TaxID=151549 RepID=A0A4C1XHM5_EUMVA|nr:Probable enoyl-CoA hydratase echA8 [Eumeta japonica]